MAACKAKVREGLADHITALASLHHHSPSEPPHRGTLGTVERDWGGASENMRNFLTVLTMSKEGAQSPLPQVDQTSTSQKRWKGKNMYGETNVYLATAHIN